MVVGLWQSRRRFRVENIACRTIQKVGCIHRICPPLKMGIIKAGCIRPGLLPDETLVDIIGNK